MYLFTIFILFLIIFFNEYLLIQNHGKIMNYPLRKKLISDISNILMFLSSTWFTYEFFNKKLLLVSLFVYIMLFLTYISRNAIYKIISKYIVYNQNAKTTIKELVKLKSMALSRNTANSYDTSHNQTSYRECMILTIISFCKTVTFLFVIVLLLCNILNIYNNTILSKFSINLDTTNSLTDFFILLNNAGLLFSFYKFIYDKKAIVQEKSDDERYLEIVKRLDRNEHSI